MKIFIILGLLLFSVDGYTCAAHTGSCSGLSNCGGVKHDQPVEEEEQYKTDVSEEEAEELIEILEERIEESASEEEGVVEYKDYTGVKCSELMKEQDSSEYWQCVHHGGVPVEEEK